MPVVPHSEVSALCTGAPELPGMQDATACRRVGPLRALPSQGERRLSISCASGGRAAIDSDDAYPPLQHWATSTLASQDA